jgi:hypothetical protein
VALEPFPAGDVAERDTATRSTTPSDKLLNPLPFVLR